MTPGKSASQAGHAYLGAFIQATGHDAGFRQQAQEYASEQPGTKVCLQASLDEVLRLKDRADQLGLPNFLVVDSGHQAFNNGLETTTAWGFGPCTREQAKPIVKKLKLHP